MKGKIQLKTHGRDTAYVSLPNHPGMSQAGASKKSVRLAHLIPDYKGADVIMDFDAKGELIGIEILV